MKRRTESWTFAKRFKELKNVTWDEFLDKCGITTTFLIIDEHLLHIGIMVLILACGNHAIMDISPCSLQKSNMWGFEDVCFREKNLIVTLITFVRKFFKC
ncbi:hypothetical protein Glove_216g48 [Diversispora epigaea]|uniref:Uncharacterized protein n=1 Tax=Diversispora epigaea TaxID=1348612 RepID=A0A397IKF3_9GLOM|nr:hypothetical protein Glove_216g48 [Diversispora epigaea]